MTTNKQTVTRYMEGFRKKDHEMVMSCLTDDVLWEMPGFYQLAGKGAFDREMEDDAFEPDPDIFVTRLIEEDNIVVAEGKVLSKRKDGSTLEAAFCDVFHMEDGKIRQLTNYLMEKKQELAAEH
ncbi:Ketosteroid isomerase-related protein [Chitinophaga sp. YR627]|uniref:nuclear transport factor 2 family protein n=1 Tax=Chitinophaga sp. YR627 TaxID=1881041 RepID=UPI0008DFF377|nr:nuclear transport factor 2 family protein [Chitinophaga sp. YR627]SFM82277.1 Ketosteroid isomerase-related protein [Chitinophaga sp. YR627]